MDNNSGLEISVPEWLNAGMCKHVNLQIRLVLKHLPATVTSTSSDDVLAVHFLHVPLKSSTRTKDFKAVLTLKVF